MTLKEGAIRVKSVKTTGSTVEEAILLAVAQLGVSRDRLDIEVVEEPEKGVLGIFGRKKAIVNASIKQSKGDIAREFLDKLFEKMDLDVDVIVKDEGDTLAIELMGDNLGIVIGYRGETLDAIQYLTSLVVNKEGDKYKRVLIDAEGYRQKREETLRRLARRLAYKVERTKKEIVLEPMNPYERRIIHSTLQYNSNVRTYSQGEEPYRRVVISLK